ncbi:MAG: hypothetical protein HY319_20885 [Armatimonadetes bacterium]|nr:hypothetical protein [Armatimonadota bacterium]
MLEEELRAAWPEELAQGLRACARGDHEEARRRVGKLRDSASDPAARCLLDNMLALILLEEGDYVTAQETFEEAVRNWLSGIDTSPRVLEDFRRALEEGGRPTEARSFLAHLHEWKMGGRKHPLLDPWRDSGTSSLGGQHVSAASGPEDAGMQAWERHLREACSRVAAGELEGAAASANEAVRRAQELGGKALGMCLALNLTALVYFRMGDYASAQAGYQDSMAAWKEEWRTPDNLPLLETFLAALAETWPGEAQRVRERWSSGCEPPLLNPWTDVGGELLAGDGVSVGSEIDDPEGAWRERLQSGLRAYGEQDLETASRQFSEAVRCGTLAGSPVREAVAANWVAVASFRAGDYSAAKSNYDRALRLWGKGLPDLFPALAAELESILAAAPVEQATAAAARLRAGQRPFVDPWGEDVPAGASTTVPPEPEKDWDDLVREGLKQLSQRRFDQAELELVRARDAAERLPGGDARLVFAENLLAVSGFLRGDYAHAEESLDRARRFWKSGQHDRKSAAPALEDLLGLLEGAGLASLARQWEFSEPPLLDPFRSPPRVAEEVPRRAAEAPVPAPAAERAPRPRRWTAAVIVGVALAALAWIGSTPRSYPVTTEDRARTGGLEIVFRVQPGKYRAGKPVWLKLFVKNAGRQPVAVSFAEFRVSRPGRLFFLERLATVWETREGRLSEVLAPGQKKVYETAWKWNEPGQYVMEAVLETSAAERLRLTPRIQ